jgi:polyhydroxyalkanoate synthesis regulator phasin
MIGTRNYLNAYVDRRMKYVIEEWQLSTRHDIADFSSRLEMLEQEIPHLKAFENAAADKLTRLEIRAKKLRERV